MGQGGVFMTQHNLFFTPVQVFKIVPSDEQYQNLNSLLEIVYARCSNGVWALEDGKSTGQFDLFLHGRPELSWITEPALAYVKDYWNTLNYMPGADIKLDSCWANLHTHGQATGEHSHCGGWNRSHISAVFYFKKPANSGHLEFIDPLEYIHRMTPAKEYSEMVGVYQPFIAEQFDLIIFPSWLGHRTQPNKSTEDRVAISMNFKGFL
jgi:uncharacterized protein (TIGR02466 family)